jgi:hypothetical protein
MYSGASYWDTTFFVVIALITGDLLSGLPAQMQSNKPDADAYLGLLGPKDKLESLTRNPRDMVASVNDLEHPYTPSDPNTALPPEVSLIARMACQSEMVVVARPLTDEPFFNQAETWILTRHRLEILETLKPAGQSPQTAETVYVHPSGAMSIGGRIVSTVVTAYPLLNRGETYLFFLKRIPESGHYRTVIGAPILRGESTWTVHAGADVQIPIRLRVGVSTGDIIAHVAAAKCGGVK